MYNAIAGSCAEDKANAGGGGSPPAASVSPATTSAGNYNNALKVALWNSASTDYSYSNGIKDGSNSTFGTASSPTRTTQDVSIVTTDYYTSYFNNGTPYVAIMIGGYIRNNGFTSSNKYAWSVQSTAVSQNLSNGCSIISSEVRDNNAFLQDNTTMGNGGYNNGFGIYNIHPTTYSFSASGTGFYMLLIQHGSGRGAGSLPAQGDDFTIRVTVSDMDASATLYTAIHDITFTFT